MKILVLNCGSSSIKYQFFDMANQTVPAKGLVSRVGSAGAVLDHRPDGRPAWKYNADIYDHTMGIDHVIKALMHAEHGVIKDINEIDAVGHRVVHGGERFASSVLIDKEVMEMLYTCIDLAPLHNPPNIKGIEAAQAILPKTPQVGVFDTSFHMTMPAKAYIYGLPYIIYEKERIRRFGFHGTSHLYVAREAAKLIGKPQSELRIITAHLGNGASMAAVKYGKSIDTSMGFTPLEGLMMGTRAGDLDPAIILLLMARQELTNHEASTLLNKHSGLLGVSGISNDMRDIVDAAGKGNERAKLALDIFCYRITKYIGSYAAAMGGVDAVVFTAGVGENASLVRKLVCEPLGFLGATVDDAVNDAPSSKPRFISTADSKLKVLVVPTNEELVIAEDTERIVKGLGR